MKENIFLFAAIQNDRDRIGYTKRKRKNDDCDVPIEPPHSELNRDGSSGSPQNNEDSPDNYEIKDIKIDLVSLELGNIQFH